MLLEALAFFFHLSVKLKIIVQVFFLDSSRDLKPYCRLFIMRLIDDLRQSKQHTDSNIKDLRATHFSSR